MDFNDFPCYFGAGIHFSRLLSWEFLHGRLGCRAGDTVLYREKYLHECKMLFTKIGKMYKLTKM